MGAATAVGAGFTLTDNTASRFSVDFNPVVDRLRVVTGNGQNYRVHPVDGMLVAQDTSLRDGADTPLISGVAYSSHFAGATEPVACAAGLIHGVAAAPHLRPRRHAYITAQLPRDRGRAGS
jgi:hypothetical protein